MCIGIGDLKTVNYISPKLYFEPELNEWIENSGMCASQCWVLLSCRSENNRNWFDTGLVTVLSNVTSSPSNWNSRFYPFSWRKCSIPANRRSTAEQTVGYPCTSTWREARGSAFVENPAESRHFSVVIHWLIDLTWFQSLANCFSAEKLGGVLMFKMLSFNFKEGLRTFFT